MEQVREQIADNDTQPMLPMDPLPNTREPPVTNDASTACANNTTTLPVPPVQLTIEEVVVTHAGRRVQPPRRFKDFVAYEALAGSIDNDEPNMLMAYKATTDPDTMYYHEAMRAPDKKEFQQAMQKEVDGHSNNGHWKLVSRDELLTGTRVLLNVRSMKRKRKITFQEIYK